MEGGINLIIPGSIRASHDVEIVQITAGSRRDNMISFGDQHQVSILYGNRFIKAIIGVDTLKAKAIMWLHMMIIGLFQVCLVWWILGIMFMWWKRRPVARRSNHLNHDQAFCLLINIQYMLNTTL